MYLTNSYHTDNTENYRNKTRKCVKSLKNSTKHIVRTESLVYNKEIMTLTLLLEK